MFTSYNTQPQDIYTPGFHRPSHAPKISLTDSTPELPPSTNKPFPINFRPLIQPFSYKTPSAHVKQAVSKKPTLPISCPPSRHKRQSYNPFLCLESSLKQSPFAIEPEKDNLSFTSDSDHCFNEPKDDEQHIHLGATYITPSHSAESNTKSYSISSYNSSDYPKNESLPPVFEPTFVNLKDLTISSYEKLKNERDSVIQKYVECSDKQKGTASMMKTWLKRWLEEERQGVVKTEYCFVDIDNKDKDKQNETKARKSKKKSKSNGKKHRKSKKKKMSTKCLKKTKRKSKKKKNKESKIPFLVNLVKSTPPNTIRTNISCSTREMNKSMDLFDFEEGVKVESPFPVERKPKIAKCKSTRQHARMQTVLYDTPSQTIESSSRCVIGPCEDEESDEDLLDINIPFSSGMAVGRRKALIPQPRASIVEKSFTWSDCGDEMQVPVPFMYSDDDF